MSKVADYQQEIRDAIDYFERLKVYAAEYEKEYPESKQAPEKIDLAIAALRTQIEPGWIQVSEGSVRKVRNMAKLMSGLEPLRNESAQSTMDRMRLFAKEIVATIDRSLMPCELAPSESTKDGDENG